jgi:hypothetical protein
VCFGDLGQGKKVVHARVVHQGVQPTELGDRRRDQLSGFGRLADVGANRFGFSARGLDIFNQFLGFVASSTRS